MPTRRRGPRSSPHSWLVGVLLTTLAIAVVLACGGTPIARATIDCVDSPPRNTVAPEISGEPSVDETLSSTRGTWIVCPPYDSSYQWLRDGVAIPGATSSSYIVTDNDVAHSLAARITITTLNYEASAQTDDLFIENGDDGPAAEDQTDPVTDAAPDDPPASPIPMTYSGPASPGTYTRMLWSAEDTETSGGLDAVDTAAAGKFSVSGVVLDIATGNAIPGATVTVNTIGAPQTPVTTSTDGNGSFAFLNLISPASSSTSHSLVVTAFGYGSYTLNNLNDTPGDAFQTTVMLGPDPQTWNDSLTSADTAPQDPADIDTSLPGLDYYSTARVPPTIRVHEYKLDSNCSKVVDQSGNYVSLDYLNVNWRFYVVHVAAGEINGNAWPRPSGSPPSAGYFQRQAATSVMAAISNYAWWFRLTTPASQQAVVDNSTAYQCFARAGTLPNHAPRPVWSTWVNDALRNRVARPTAPNKLTFTEYKSGGINAWNSVASHCGTNTFSDPVYDSTQQLQQLGAKAAEQICGLNQLGDWKKIVNHYYAPRSTAATKRIGRVFSGAKPPRPQQANLVANNLFPGRIDFQFKSTIGGVNVGWRYVIIRSAIVGGPGTRICCKLRNFGNVTTTLSSFPPSDDRSNFANCYYYRVAAFNPLGHKKYVYFSSPTNTVPGTNNHEICPG